VPSITIPAAVHDRDPVAQVVRLLHVVGGQDHRPGGVLRHPAADLLPHVTGGADVEGHRRLVEEEHPGIGHQAPHQVHLLAHAARQPGDLPLGDRRKPQPLEQLVDPRVGDLRVHAVELAEHPELLADVEEAVARVLSSGDDRDPRPQLAELLHDVEAVDLGGSRARQEEGDQDLDERGLTGPVGPEHAVELALADLEVHRGERRHRLVPRLEDAAQAMGLDGKA